MTSHEHIKASRKTGYRGKHPHGLTANQIAATAITFLLALLVLTIAANAVMLGVPVRQQMHDIAFTEVD